LSGGFEPGPEEQDSTVTYEGIRNYSIIKGSKIVTFKIDETNPMDTIKTTASVDSTVFESTIRPDGKITTKKISETHFTIPFEDNIKRKKRH
jgi:hypothetical protein